MTTPGAGVVRDEDLRDKALRQIGAMAYASAFSMEAIANYVGHLEALVDAANMRFSETHSALEALQGMEHVKLYMREAAYALELRALLSEVATLKRYDPNGKKTGLPSATRALWPQASLLERIDAALAKNPNPSDQSTTEASLRVTGEASGPVGLGPDVPVTEHIPRDK